METKNIFLNDVYGRELQDDLKMKVGNQLRGYVEIYDKIGIKEKRLLGKSNLILYIPTQRKNQCLWVRGA